MKEVVLYYPNGDTITYKEGKNCLKITDNRERDIPVLKVRFEDQIMKVFKGIPFVIQIVEAERPPSEFQDDLRPAKRPGFFS